MIVRNEAHVIEQALESVAPWIDSWVIVDTGSTDATREVVRAWFAARGIPGHLHERAWTDFGTNRSEALRLCDGVADYALVMDADDLLVGEPAIGELEHDAYLLRFGRDIVYWRRQIFRTGIGWRYAGVIHEAAVHDGPFTEKRIDGTYWIESRRLGDRNRDPEKYRRDAARLAAVVQADPTDARAVFYLAQSYLDAGNLVDAALWYQKRAWLAGWDEETFVAALRRAECLARLGGHLAERIEVLLHAYQVCPWRAESLHELARTYRSEGQYELGYLFAKRAVEIPFPDRALLFVDRATYDWRRHDELSICAYYTGHLDESFAHASLILDSEEIEEADRERVLANRDYCVPHRLAATAVYPQEVARRLGAQRQPALRVGTQRQPALGTGTQRQPALLLPAEGHSENRRADVTFTITTCRRLELFERTMSSFLHCFTDLDRIARWLCVDDGSSAADLARMRELYPFLELVPKGRGEKGHAGSMNVLRAQVETPLWLHLEDDWQFFAPGDWITRAAAVLDDSAEIAQVLFNRNYGETPECRRIAGGIVQRTARERFRYRLHQHATPGSAAYRAILATLPADRPTVAYWPHFSLRPSLMRTEAVRALGPFDPAAAHFEREFAERYTAAGLRSAFLDAIVAVHTGRLTWEPRETKPNAYDLNAEPQFTGRRPGAERMGTVERIRVINLDRRPDRWDGFVAMAGACGGDLAARAERFPAVDGRTLVADEELLALFQGNDFGTRRGVVGCASSHLALWREALERGPILILEDDVRLEPGALESLASLDLPLDELDLCLLGWTSAAQESAAAALQSTHRRLAAVPWSSYVGGLFAYVVTPHGARRLLDLVERDGIRCGIDRFVHIHATELRTACVAPPLAHTALAHGGNAVDTDIQRDAESLLAPARTGPTRVKLLGSWGSSEEICRDWNRMSQGEFRWNDLEIAWDDSAIDYYAIVNYPPAGEAYDPSRTIVLQTEPWCHGEEQTWGVKTWGEWARPDKARFLQVRSHDRFLNTAFWQMKATYRELREARIEKSPEASAKESPGTHPPPSDRIATLCSGKYFDPGHKKRVDFLHFVEAKNDDLVRIDVFGYDNPHGFRNYRGPHPPGEKDVALLPYRYFFAAENNREPNFVTEKLWEPLLAETLCFYWGAPNAAEWVDPQAFVAIDLDDFEAAFATIRAAVSTDAWSRSLAAIRRERVKVLEQYQFFPLLENALRELRAPAHPTAEYAEYRRVFAWLPARAIETACFVHSYTRGGDTGILREILERIAGSGLAAALDALVVVNVGDPVELPQDLALPAATTLVNHSTSGAVYEYPTLQTLHLFSRFHPEARVLYLHTKGASHAREHTPIQDWRRYLLYQMVDRFRDGWAALAEHDAAGCDLREWPSRHFSGNFWWARAAYLATLPSPSARERHAAEWWVLSGRDCRFLQLHDSGRDHYRQRYLPEEYVRSEPASRPQST